MATPHDKLFWDVFGQTEHAVGLLRGILPQEIAASVDWRSLTRLRGSFRDDEMRKHHTDVLFEARVAGERTLICVLLEHKSTAEPFTAMQVLGYVLAIWQSFRRANPKAPRVPSVVPVVVHHGNRRWRSPRAVVDLVDLARFEGRLRRTMTSMQPEFRLYIVDLAAFSEADIASRVTAVMAQLTLLLLQHVRGRPPDEALAAIARWSKLVRAVAARADGRTLRDLLWWYVLAATDVQVEDLRNVAADILEQAPEEVVSTADKLIAQGRTEGETRGRAEGETRGRAEGRAEGRVAVVLRLLATRFGPLPDEVTARIAAATIDELDRIAVRILDARTLDDVFADG